MTVDLIREILGQATGILAVILGFVSFQLKGRKQILYMQMACCGLFCLHYGLIGAVTGAVMNGIGVIRIWVYNSDWKIFSGKYWPIVFAAIMLTMGIITWQAWYSVFSVAGIVVNTLCLSFKNPQNIRKSILVSSPLALAYNCFVFSLGGIVYEIVAIASAAIGLFRFYKKGIE